MTQMDHLTRAEECADAAEVEFGLGNAEKAWTWLSRALAHIDRHILERDSVNLIEPVVREAPDGETCVVFVDAISIVEPSLEGEGRQAHSRVVVSDIPRWFLEAVQQVLAKIGEVK